MCVCFIYHCLSLHFYPFHLSYILELLVFVRMKKRSLHNSMLSRSWLVHVWKFIVILLTYWCIEHSPPLFVWEVPPRNIIRVQCHLHSLEVSPCWELYWFAFNGVHNWCYNLTWQKKTITCKTSYLTTMNIVIKYRWHNGALWHMCRNSS